MDDDVRAVVNRRHGLRCMTISHRSSGKERHPASPAAAGAVHTAVAPARGSSSTKTIQTPPRSFAALGSERHGQESTRQMVSYCARHAMNADAFRPTSSP